MNLWMQCAIAYRVGQLVVLGRIWTIVTFISIPKGGRYSCGLARQTITEFLRRHLEEHIFVGSDWYDTLEAFKNNPSVIGFTAEQLVIATSSFHLPKISHSMIISYGYQRTNDPAIMCHRVSTKKPLTLFCQRRPEKERPPGADSNY